MEFTVRDPVSGFEERLGFTNGAATDEVTTVKRGTILAEAAARDYRAEHIYGPRAAEITNANTQAENNATSDRTVTAITSLKDELSSASTAASAAAVAAVIGPESAPAPIPSMMTSLANSRASSTAPGSSDAQPKYQPPPPMGMPLPNQMNFFQPGVCPERPDAPCLRLV